MQHFCTHYSQYYCNEVEGGSSDNGTSLNATGSV
jgi:hypothetical protein